jgi:hypothetical protein
MRRWRAFRAHIRAGRAADTWESFGGLAIALPGILTAARELVEKKRPYLDCIHGHYGNLLSRLGRKEGEGFFDGGEQVMTGEYAFKSFA